MLVFRERTRDAMQVLELPLSAGTWKAERIAGEGEAVWRDGRLHVTVPGQLRYLWVKLTS